MAICQGPNVVHIKHKELFGNNSQQILITLTVSLAKYS